MIDPYQKNSKHDFEIEVKLYTKVFSAWKSINCVVGYLRVVGAIHFIEKLRCVPRCCGACFMIQAINKVVLVEQFRAGATDK